jgi:hypothetical protein
VPDAYQRARTFAFPVQLDRLRAGMRRFVRGLFAPDPTQADSALFRGFYPGATQEGLPVDVYSSPRLLPGLVPAIVPPPPQTGGAYFVHDLLTEVVFADAELAAASSSALAARQRARLFMLGGLGLAFLAVALLLIILASSNAGLMRATRHASQDVADRVHPEAGMYDKLTTLDALRRDLVELEKNRRNTPWWRALGAYSAHPLIDPGVRLYSDHAIESLIRPAVEGLQAELNGRSAGDPGDIVDFYYKFRAWHLLRKPTEIVPDDKPLIVRAIQRVYASQLEAVPSDARPKIPGLIADQVEFLASHPVWMEKLIARYYPPDDLELLRRGQQALRAHWDAGAFYRDPDGPGESEVQANDARHTRAESLGALVQRGGAGRLHEGRLAQGREAADRLVPRHHESRLGAARRVRRHVARSGGGSHARVLGGLPRAVGAVHEGRHDRRADRRDRRDAEDHDEERFTGPEAAARGRRSVAARRRPRSRARSGARGLRAGSQLLRGSGRQHGGPDGRGARQAARPEEQPQRP